MLPSVAARDLDEDPEGLSLLCLPLIAYARAKHAVDHAKSEEDLRNWSGSKIMDYVQDNIAFFHKKKLANARIK